MTQTEEIVAFIVSYGHKYREKHLSKYDPDLLLNDWWSALDFFFGRACYQGRLDIVSHRVYAAVIETLAPIFSGEDKTASYWELQQQQWKSIEDELRKRIGKGNVGKGGDVMMVISSLDFIGRLPDLNIVKYSVEQIKLGRVSNHYAELQRIMNLKGEGIFQVGRKVASFYLRDLVSIFGLDDNIPDEDAVVLQPVDVHVEKVANLTGIVGHNANHDDIRKAIVSLCKENNVSPLLFNQGAWFVSYNHPSKLYEAVGK